MSCFLLASVCLATPTDTAKDYDDLVLLDNGAMIKGKILEGDLGSKMKIEREDGQIIEIPRKRILLITKAGDPKVHILQQQIIQERISRRLETKWNKFTRVGLLYNDSIKVFAVSTGFGLVTEKLFIISAAIGWNHYPKGEGMPIYLELLGYLQKTKAQPYWYFDFGIMPFFGASGEGLEGYYLLGWGIGVAIPWSSGFGTTVQLGYRAQSFKSSFRNRQIGLISFMAGLNF